MGARNCQRICRKASLNSSLIMMCWFTPKFEEGRSVKVWMLKSGFSSQSGGRSLGRLDDFCEGRGEGPGEDGENEGLVEDVDEDFGGVDSDLF